MKTVSPYVNFPGNAFEAFKFYQSIFGGELQVVRFGEMPGMEVPEHVRDKIMNAQLTLIDGATLMGSDAVGFGPPPQYGNTFSIAIQTSSLEETERLFGKLSEGGEVTMPLQPTEWAERFGMLKDKFGVQWMLNFTGSKVFGA